MGFSFTFTQLNDLSEIRSCVDFIASHNVGYPRYDSWVQRTEAELVSGYKGAIIALSHDCIVGDLIYQRHKVLHGFLEVKNFRIDERVRNRDFGRFMFKQIEEEARREGYLALIADVRSDQPNVLRYMVGRGFIPIISASLYDENVEDTTIVKFLQKNDKDLIVRSTKGFVNRVAV